MAALAGEKQTDLYTQMVVTKGAPKVHAQDVFGKVRYIGSTYTVGSGDNLGTTALLKMFQIPKGAKVIDVALTTAKMGTAGDLDIGWAASAELDENGDAIEAASADGFFADTDVNAAAVERRKAAVSAAGVLKRFDAAVDVEITVPEATTAGGDVTLECWYIID